MWSHPVLCHQHVMMTFSDDTNDNSHLCHYYIVETILVFLYEEILSTYRLSIAPGNTGSVLKQHMVVIYLLEYLLKCDLKIYWKCVRRP